MERPLGSYNGKVVILSDEGEINKAMEEIGHFDLVGFDTEARPTFKKGQIRKISLLQIATSEKVYLLRIKRTGLLKSIVGFLKDANVIKVGIGLDDDIQLLNRLEKFTPEALRYLSIIERVAEPSSLKMRGYLFKLDGFS